MDGQTSIFDYQSNKIFFFGGIYIDYVQNQSFHNPFHTSFTFDMTTGTWSGQNLKGQIPSDRYDHTTTLCNSFLSDQNFEIILIYHVTVVESTNRDVLLYGGNSNEDGRLGKIHLFIF